MNNIIQARFVFEKAQVLWEPYRDISNGLVTGLLQDAAELALWAIVKSIGVSVKDQDGFVAILEKIDAQYRKIDGKAQILEVNKARISYKHYGLTPSSSDVPRLIEGTRFFLNENVKNFLQIDFNSISLADDILNPEIRDLLKEAERFRDSGNLEDSLVRASIAFQKIHRIALITQFGDIPDISDIYQLFPPTAQEKARDIAHGLSHFWERYSSSHAMFTLGVTKGLLDEIEERRLIISISVSGNIIGISRRPKSTASIENVNFLISNITDIARRIR